MKHVIHQSLINDIKIYNEKNGTKFGYSCSSLFALQQITNDNGEIEYVPFPTHLKGKYQTYTKAKNEWDDFRFMTIEDYLK